VPVKARRSEERLRAARLARHYREQERLSIAQIARRLGRSPATVRGYLYDPDGSRARSVKERYRGECSRCGAPTSGSGPGRARTVCARCNGRSAAKWPQPRIEDALRAWYELYGREASSTDLSLGYARARAPRDGGVRLRRLTQGWAGGQWPAASVVQYHYGSVRRANQVALGDHREPGPRRSVARPAGAARQAHFRGGRT
jgi:hypothetical protein